MTEILPLGTMPESQLGKIESYVNAQRIRTDRRRALETIFGQEMLQYNNGIFTDITTTYANLDGIVGPQEIKLVDANRNCKLTDEEGNFLLNQEIVGDLTTYGLHPNCITCRWGINGEGGHNTGCPRVESTAPLYLKLDKFLRPEPIHLEMCKIKYMSIDKLKLEISKTKTAQEAYTILSKSCPDTHLPWYRYTFGIMHMGTYMNLPVSIYHNERSQRKQFDISIRNKQYNLLDIGCGEGTLTTRLANIPSEFSLKGSKRRLFDRVIGLDINAGMIKSAKKNNKLSNLEFINGAISKLPAIEFDAVVFNGLTPYLTYDLAVELTTNLKKIMPSKGRIYTAGSTAQGFSPTQNKYLKLARASCSHNCTQLINIAYNVLQLAATERKGKEIDFKTYLGENGFQMQNHIYLDPGSYPTLDPASLGIYLVKQ